MNNQIIRFAVAFFLALGMMLPACAQGMETPAAGSTQVQAEVSEDFSLSFPADTKIPFNEELTNIGNVSLTGFTMDSTVRVTGTLPVLRSAGNPLDTIGCTTDFGQKTLKPGDVCPVVITIPKTEWQQAAGGKYSTAITFMVEVVKP